MWILWGRFLWARRFGKAGRKGFLAKTIDCEIKRVYQYAMNMVCCRGKVPLPYPSFDLRVKGAGTTLLRWMEIRVTLCMGFLFVAPMICEN